MNDFETVRKVLAYGPEGISPTSEPVYEWTDAEGALDRIEADVIAGNLSKEEVVSLRAENQRLRGANEQLGDMGRELYAENQRLREQITMEDEFWKNPGEHVEARHGIGRCVPLKHYEDSQTDLNNAEAENQRLREALRRIRTHAHEQAAWMLDNLGNARAAQELLDIVQMADDARIRSHDESVEP